eukprot:COSAG01_NODE_2166_length_8254_cov_9.294421_4_plen_248_part_00
MNCEKLMLPSFRPLLLAVRRCSAASTIAQSQAHAAFLHWVEAQRWQDAWGRVRRRACGLRCQPTSPFPVHVVQDLSSVTLDALHRAPCVRCVGADHTAEQHGVRKVRPWLSLQAGGASGVAQGRLEDRGALSVFLPERGQRRATHPLLHQIEHVRSVPARPMPVALIGVAFAGEADVPPAGAGHLAHGDRGQQGQITLEGGRKCAHTAAAACSHAEPNLQRGWSGSGSASETASTCNVRETKIAAQL